MNNTSDKVGAYLLDQATFWHVLRHPVQMVLVQASLGLRIDSIRKVCEMIVGFFLIVPTYILLCRFARKPYLSLPVFFHINKQDV